MSALDCEEDREDKRYYFVGSSWMDGTNRKVHFSNIFVSEWQMYMNNLSDSLIMQA